MKAEQYINLVVQSAIPEAITLTRMIEATVAVKELQALMAMVRNGADKSKLPPNLLPYKNIRRAKREQQWHHTQGPTDHCSSIVT